MKIGAYGIVFSDDGFWYSRSTSGLRDYGKLLKRQGRLRKSILNGDLNCHQMPL